MSSTTTFLLRYSVRPTKQHPEFESLGEAFVNCWMVYPSLEEAEKIAVTDIERDQWVILERMEAFITVPGDYEGEEDDGLQYFEQAQIDSEVYVFHRSPRYSVFRIVAEVERKLPDGSKDQQQAQILLSNESLAEGDTDFFDLGFWSPERCQAAVSRAHELVRENGMSIVSIAHQGPVDWLTADDTLSELCDYAEEEAECVIFSNEDWRSKRALTARHTHFEGLASEESFGARPLPHGGAIACIHPFADELDELARLGLEPSDCSAADGYWRIDGDVVFVQINSAAYSAHRVPGLYVRVGCEPCFVNLVAVVAGDTVATYDLNWATKEFLKARVNRPELTEELRPLVANKRWE